MDNKICFALVVPVASVSAQKNQTPHTVVRAVSVDQRQIFLFSVPQTKHPSTGIDHFQPAWVVPFASWSEAWPEGYGAVLIIVHDPVLEVRCPISCTNEVLLGCLSPGVV